MIGMRGKKAPLTSLWRALDEAAFGSERTLNLRESLPSAAEARARTETWLRARQVMNADEVLVITGRGNQSAGGVGIVRREILAMMPSLRRRGIVTSWKEHSPGSIVVKLAPTTALFSAARRRRDNPARSPGETSVILGLDSQTMSMLRQLAIANLEALGVRNSDGFLKEEMTRIFSILSSAVPESERTESSLREAIRHAIEEGFDSVPEE